MIILRKQPPIVCHHTYLGTLEVPKTINLLLIIAYVGIIIA
jgi:hypothetical protein